MGIVFILALSLPAKAQQGVVTSYIRLQPSTLPTVCRLGDLRFDTSSSQLEFCNGSNAWTPFVNSSSVIAISKGGTGQTSANAAFNALSPMTTGGDLIYGGASGAATRLANGSNGQYLTSSGGTSAPTWTTFVGLSNPMTTLGDIIYENSTPGPARLGGNTTSSKQFLTQTGTGSVSAAPVWGAIAATDLPNPSSSSLGGVQSIAAVSHNFLTSISTSGVPAQAQPAFTDISGTLAVSQGGTNQSTLTAGSVPFITSGPTFSEDNTNFTWNNTNKQLFVGAASGNGTINVNTTTSSYYGLNIATTGATPFNVSTQGNIPIGQFQASANSATQPAQVNFNFSRGSIASRSANNSGDILGRLEFNGYNGSSFNANGNAAIDGVATQAGGTGYGGKLSFKTNTNGGSSLVEALNIDNTQTANFTGGAITAGTNGTTAGTIALANSTAGGGSVTIQNPSTTSGNAYNFNLPATAGSTGQVLTSAGGGSSAMTWGSSLTNPMNSVGDIIVGGSSGAATRLGIGTTGQVLDVSSGTPAWITLSGNTSALKAPTFQSFTSTGTQTGWQFSVTSANATVGATYTNNSNTYTVQGTISAGTTLYMSGTGATSGSTLTKSSGTGDATITFSSKLATATYTTPTGPSPLYLKVRIVGGGGGGSNSGTAAGTTSGGNGTSSVFGANLIVCGGGQGGVWNSGYGGSGGTASLGTGPSGLAIVGQNGGGFSENLTSSATNLAGGYGGNAPFFNGGGSGQANGTGQAGVTNTGGGGAGGGTGGAASTLSGAGGGGGGFVEAYISSPASSYPYIIGSGGAASTGPTTGFVGGAGAAGYIQVEEIYQ